MLKKKTNRKRIEKTKLMHRPPYHMLYTRYNSGLLGHWMCCGCQSHARTLGRGDTGPECPGTAALAELMQLQVPTSARALTLSPLPVPPALHGALADPRLLPR